MSEQYDVYLMGVVGQGVGFLASILLRAARHAGLSAQGLLLPLLSSGVEAHAVRLSSTKALGSASAADFVGALPTSADLVLALERGEALRAARGPLKEGGVLAWYDAVAPRPDTQHETTVRAAEVEEACGVKGARAIMVYLEKLPAPRMEGVALLATLAELGLPPGIRREHLAAALKELLPGDVLDLHLALLEP